MMMRNREGDDFVDHIRAKQTPARRASASLQARLRSVHIPTANDEALDQAIDSMLDAIVVELGRQEDDLTENASIRGGYALLVEGEAGAGKTQAIGRLLRQRPEFQPRRDGSSPVASFVAPSPFTLATLGNTLATGLGYKSNRMIKETHVWPLVHSLLADRGVRIVHIDEAQHGDQMRDIASIQRVESTLKSLMQSSQWPVWLILSGLPELGRFFRDDPSMRRRVRVVEFPTLLFPEDVPAVKDTVERFASLARSIDCATVMTDEVVHRLMHSSLFQYGIVTEMIQDAIGECARIGETTLTIIHLAEVYAARTGVQDDENPFLARRFTNIDVSKALYVDEIDENGKPTGRRSVRARS